MFNRHFLILVVLGVMAYLVACPSAGAAQYVGRTPSPMGSTVQMYLKEDFSMGLIVRYVGLDGTDRYMRAEAPRAGEIQRQFALKYSFEPPKVLEGETRYPCEYVRKGPHLWSILGAQIIAACGFRSTDGVTTDFIVQSFKKYVKDFGGPLSGAPSDLYLSLVRTPNTAGDRVPVSAGINVLAPQLILITDNKPLVITDIKPLVITDNKPLGSEETPCPTLTAAMRWSKYYSGTRKFSAKRHFPVLFGTVNCGSDIGPTQGVFGPGGPFGSPLDKYGRNVYIDTLNSDYGEGWHRVMGVLTQGPNGTFCYEFSRKGGSDKKTGISKNPYYQVTVIGPGLTPVTSWRFSGPDFTFGNDAYKPLTDKWGTNFSDRQAAALRQQAAQMGPGYKKKVKGTDCGKTLRQLPDSFFTTG